MGFRISTLKNLPYNHNYYFILIGDYHIDDRINNFFREDFYEIADKIGNSAIVQSTTSRNLEHEIYKSLEKIIFDKKNNYSKLIKSFENHFPGLLILDCHPRDLDSENFFLFITFQQLLDKYPSNNELLQDLIALSENRNQNIINKFRGRKGFITKVCDSLILEPNFMGCGINLKKIVK